MGAAAAACGATFATGSVSSTAAFFCAYLSSKEKEKKWVKKEFSRTNFTTQFEEKNGKIVKFQSFF